MRKKFLKENNNGIVLIALVVSIVVMIILANVVLKENSENEIIQHADEANLQTEYNAILEFFIAAQSPDENMESDILQTAQNFVKNNEISDVKYTLTPDPFEKSYLYSKEQQIVIVKGQVGYYKFRITKKEVTYIGKAGQEEIQLYNY